MIMETGTLALNRKVGQVITIGPNISVTVVRIGRDSVGLAIRAPKELHIDRVDKLTSPNELNETLQAVRAESQL